MGITHFGFEAWDRKTLDLKCVWQQSKGQISQCSYMARVRVRVRAGEDDVVTREGLEDKALARKVSDEWTVPVCFLHQKALHAAGSEQDWWSQQKIDPLAVAQHLWAESRHGVEPDSESRNGTARVAGS